MRRADPPSKEAYRLFVRLIVFRIILKYGEARRSNPINDDEDE
jgi:hypothetical protein